MTPTLEVGHIKMDRDLDNAEKRMTVDDYGCMESMKNEQMH